LDDLHSQSLLAQYGRPTLTDAQSLLNAVSGCDRVIDCFDIHDMTGLPYPRLDAALKLLAEMGLARYRGSDSWCFRRDKWADDDTTDDDDTTAGWDYDTRSVDDFLDILLSGFRYLLTRGGIDDLTRRILIDMSKSIEDFR
jgi:hypothetical protein